MKKFIFYTTEGYTEGPNGSEVDNCQVLGEARAENTEEAFRSLLRENSWIAESGFDVGSGKIVARELADSDPYYF